MLLHRTFRRIEASGHRTFVIGFGSLGRMSESTYSKARISPSGLQLELSEKRRKENRTNKAEHSTNLKRTTHMASLSPASARPPG